jgi:hypothetical protein
MSVILLLCIVLNSSKNNFTIEGVVLFAVCCVEFFTKLFDHCGVLF